MAETFGVEEEVLVVVEEEESEDSGGWWWVGVQEELLVLIKPLAILLYFPLLQRASPRKAGRIYSVHAPQI